MARRKGVIIKLKVNGQQLLKKNEKKEQQWQKYSTILNFSCMLGFSLRSTGD